MKKFNRYLVEKLKINKDTKVKLEEKEWLKACEKIIFDYLENSYSKRYYNEEYEVEYSFGKLTISFYGQIAYVTLKRFCINISEKLKESGLIEEDYETTITFSNTNKAWRIIIDTKK